MLEAISASPATVSLTAGQNQALSVTASYSDESETEVTSSAEYVTSNNAVATVDASGVVKAVSAGSATITISYGGKTVQVAVIVSPKPVVLEAISASPDSVSLTAGQDEALSVTATYSDESETEVTSSAAYGTSNGAVATVDASGVVQAVSAGSATITITFGGKTVQVAVIVLPVLPEPVVLEAISASPATVSLTAGQNQALSVTASYSDESETTVTSSAAYVTSNSAVATVDASGIIKAQTAGTAVITVSFNGKSVSVQVTVTSSGGNSGGGTNNGNGSGVVTTPNPTEPTEPTPTPSIQPTVTQPVFSDKVNSETIRLMVVRAQQASNVSYSDVPSTSWSASVIEQAARMGFASGYTDGTFKPQNSVTRAEFATMVMKAFGLIATSTNKFSDTEGHWGADAISTLNSLGVILGYSDGSFHPNQEITRAEMVVILSRLTIFVSSETSFTDVASNNWASDAISAFAAAGIVSGKADGEFKPSESATRAESVAMIIRLIDKLLQVDSIDRP